MVHNQVEIEYVGSVRTFNFSYGNSVLSSDSPSGLAEMVSGALVNGGVGFGVYTGVPSEDPKRGLTSQEHEEFWESYRRTLIGELNLI